MGSCVAHHDVVTRRWLFSCPDDCLCCLAIDACWFGMKKRERNSMDNGVCCSNGTVDIGCVGSITDDGVERVFFERDNCDQCIRTSDECGYWSPTMEGLDDNFLLDTTWSSKNCTMHTRENNKKKPLTSIWSVDSFLPSTRFECLDSFFEWGVARKETEPWWLMRYF